MRVSRYLALFTGASVLANAIPVAQDNGRAPEQKRDYLDSHSNYYQMMDSKPPTADEMELTDAEIAEAYDRPVGGAGW